jgi:hypothetical protein
MPSKVTSQQLKIYSENIDHHLAIGSIPNCNLAVSLDMADIILDSTQKLEFKNIDINTYFADKRTNIKSMPPYIKYVDQQSMLYHINNKQVLYSKISVVPYHEFIDNISFKYFVDMYKDQIFDLVKLDKDDEAILVTNTLENILVAYNHLLESTLIEDVMFSSESKYMVRKIKNAEIKYVYGAISFDGTTRHIASNVRMPEQILSLVKLLFGACAGFFQIEYFNNVNKHEIYSFKFSMDPNILLENIINISQVQKAFEQISNQYEFGRNV